MSGRADVVVVGGGIIGCASAYELARRGVTVTLLESDRLAAEASGRNHGLLLSPLDPTLLPMARASTAAYEAFGDVAALPFGLDGEPIGFLIAIADDETQRDAGRAEADAASACGVRVEQLAAAAVRELEPNLSPEIVAGWLLEDGRRLDPAALTVSLGIAAAAHGADIRTGSTVRGLLTDGEQVTGVVTDHGRIDAETVVVSAGPWSPPLLRRVGVELRVSGTRGWLVHLAPSEPPIRHLVGRAGWHIPPSPEPSPPATAADVLEGPLREDIGTLLQPNPDGTLLVGGSRQPALSPEPEDRSVPRRLMAEAIRLVPSLAEARVLGSWWGIRPASPDGRPFVDTVREGLVVAAGHGPLGVILGGGTGLLVGSLIMGKEPPFDPSPFAFGRSI